LLRNVGHIINRVRDRELRQHDVTARQVSVLGAIKRLGGEATITEVSRRLLRDPSTIFNITNVLHRKGLIKKSRDTANRHWVCLTLTARGEEIYEKSLQKEKVALTMSALTPEERRQLVSCLEILRDNGLRELGFPPENQ
jgi:DNA-binding MarR family transcriptional regulator